MPITKHLDVELTPEEYRKRAGEFAIKANERRKIEEEKKRVVRDFNAKLKVMDKDLEELEKVVQTGHELRPVACIERSNVERGIVEFVREDDPAIVVGDRPMTAQEKQIARQPSLPGVNTEKPPAPTDDDDWGDTKPKDEAPATSKTGEAPKESGTKPAAPATPNPEDDGREPDYTEARKIAEKQAADEAAKAGGKKKGKKSGKKKAKR